MHSLHPVCKEGVWYSRSLAWKSWEGVASDRSELCAGDAPVGPGKFIYRDVLEGQLMTF